MKKTFLLFGLAVLMCLSVVAQQSRRVPRNSTAQTELKEVYSKWLTEDVTYIITPLEKLAFMRLTSDKQRERFIEEFWRRRDPNSASSQNQFRAEYYARIAYVNQNFASGSVVGWRTDRGRIYITYGKPDEVQKSSSGEIWTYNRLPNLGRGAKFEFVDNSGTGDFHLRQ